MTLIEILENAAGKYPQKRAVSFAGKSFTYEELSLRVNKLASALLALGVKPQQKVAVLCHNTSDYFEIIFACAKIAAVSEHPNIRFSPLVVKELLQESEAGIVFISSSLSDMHTLLKNTLPQSVQFISVGGGLDGCIGYEELLEKGSDTCAGIPMSDDDVVLLMHTSGSTGKPKGVLLTNRSVVWQTMVSSIEGRWSHDEVFLCTLPLYHVTNVSALQAFYVGGGLVVSDESHPEVIVDLIKRYQVTRITLIPVLMRALLRYFEETGLSCPKSLRTINYGAAPMTPELMEGLTSRMNCVFHQGYGMTETCASITVLLPEHHHDTRLLTSVGRPMFGVTLKILDEQGNECLCGEPGEVFCRTRAVMKGYLNAPALTKEVLDEDGWYRTGDIGYLDDEGFLHLVDRKDNMIISGGENIYPSEVANCIKELGEDAIEVEVFGAPDKCWGECVVAYVVKPPSSQLSAEDIADYCARHLAGFKKPKYIYFLDEIPRNSTGKVNKESLLEHHNSR